jgi:hypothetical protein
MDSRPSTQTHRDPLRGVDVMSKRILITGAGSGFGRGAALGLVPEGQ